MLTSVTQKFGTTRESTTVAFLFVVLQHSFYIYYSLGLGSLLFPFFIVYIYFFISQITALGGIEHGNPD